MITRAARLAGLWALALAAPAPAQERGTIEVEALARYTNFDNMLALDNAGGVGGRVTVYAWPRLAFELDVSRSSEYTPIRLRVVHHGPVSDRMEAVVGGGYVRNVYGAPWDVSDGGLSTVLGLRYRLTNAVWLRVGADADVMFHTDEASPFPFYHGTWGLHFGASVRLTGGSAS